jgi:hypothetical protein
MKRITLEEQARVIDSWKRRNGITGRDYVPVNGGSHRTESKRCLLHSIADEAAKQGLTPTFAANF